MRWLADRRPSRVGLDPVRLEEAADAVALSPLAASLLVVRDGKLAFEHYFNGFDAADANNVHSLTKSILSLLTGIAIDDGHLDLDTRIGDVLPPDVVGEHGESRSNISSRCQAAWRYPTRRAPTNGSPATPRSSFSTCSNGPASPTLAPSSPTAPG